MSGLSLALVLAVSSYAPETWFHVIGGNASKEGLAADIEAIADAGLSGIQFFHGGWEKDEPWPGVTEMIPCLSPKWESLVRFAADECHRRGLTFKMQNCPGWSMSGGPWIAPDRAMRSLVAFEHGKRPAFGPDDDYREIGTVTFPLEDSDDVAVTFPNPQQLNHAWAYEPDATLIVREGERELCRLPCPRGAWQDEIGMTRRLSLGGADRAKLRFFSVSSHDPLREIRATLVPEPRLDMWEAKAGKAFRSFEMSSDATKVKTKGTRTLVFGHVNWKRRNAPAPKEGTGWECDKMDPRGFEANFAGYLGRLIKAGVKIDGTLVDSWECGCQTWTWKMEEEFARRAGYALRPWLPALFGYVLSSPAETERFLLDWRNVCSRLVEENYYGTIARLARENGMSVQYETSFGDVIPGDPLRFWKDSDEAMCEFWSPHANRGYVGSFDFKPILPCASAAHLYGKRRVSAESLTSFELTFDENFDGWKRIIDEHFGRGVTHIVFHTYTHNPVVGGKPPSTSFGGGIGSPFLRGQTWWPYLKRFARYLEFCGRELERGVPAVDILLYLGDDVAHRPSERELLFGGRWKYDYLNNDVLMNGLDVADGRCVAGPAGLRVSYRVLWIPSGTFLLPATERRLAELAAKGARIVRGDFTPDWPSPLEEIGETPQWWFERLDGGERVFFCAGENEETRFVTPLALAPAERYDAWATNRVYVGAFARPHGSATLDLGRVRDWATVFVNGKKAAELWCRPYRCDVTPFLRDGANEVRVEVTSTWFNALAHEASLPEGTRTTWTKNGPKAGAAFREAGLLGPAKLVVRPDGIGGKE